MTRRPDGRRSVARVLVALLLAGWCVVAGPPATAATPEALCPAQAAAVESVTARIAAHNAAPSTFEIPAQAALAAAYDAEAAQLNAEATVVDANFAACVAAMGALTDARAGSPAIKPPPAEVEADLRAAAASVPAGWTPPPPPPPGKLWRVLPNSPVRGLYDALRRNNPPELGSATLQGSPRPAVGAPDPAYPAGLGQVFRTNARGGSAASPDHVLPLAELVQMPGFARLSPTSMYVLARAPLNFQWLSFKANTSKSSRSVAGMSGVDPAWQSQQVTLEQQLRARVQSIIDELLRIQA
ncbi:hypothetical protein [Cellulomonas shaoxiangyii]|uniref:Uncharacterized protein n=1 Tax=Cellulomonas shaoxiangyii TaxID=2566013 RepID=A0A4P7SLF7_9CELL|nr:hypothetical protein [Cellulomonas shaoxiangyii]QCB94771.1 hypothetical protein E5225_15615 [Cellulomonas shaoxiangyii]TGY86501.1 hypothetical protein E5226_01640 [Cellulomonas shaoxiangyii]